MRRVNLGTLLVCAGLAPCLSAQVLPGHRVPDGPERAVRERDFHV